MRTKLILSVVLLLLVGGPALAFSRDGDVIAVSKDGFTLIDDENKVFVFRLDKNLAAGGAMKDPPPGASPIPSGSTASPTSWWATTSM
jgi:hypothetical protein